MGRPPWDSKDLTADQNRRLSEFYRRGGVNLPRPHGGLEVNFTLISLKVEVFSSTIMSAGISRFVLHIDELVGPYGVPTVTVQNRTLRAVLRTP